MVNDEWLIKSEGSGWSASRDGGTLFLLLPFTLYPLPSTLHFLFPNSTQISRLPPRNETMETNETNETLFLHPCFQWLGWPKTCTASEKSKKCGISPHFAWPAVSRVRVVPTWGIHGAVHGMDFLLRRCQNGGHGCAMSLLRSWSETATGMSPTARKFWRQWPGENQGRRPSQLTAV